MAQDQLKLFTPQELDVHYSTQVNELVSNSFGYEMPHSFFDDFPVWNLKHHAPYTYSLGVLDSNQKLISHVGLRITKMKNKNIASDSVAMIGAVATHPQHRGQRLSTQLLQHALKIAQSHSCKHTLLWGSEHEFYKKLGFTLAGTQARIELHEFLNQMKALGYSPQKNIKLIHSQKINQQIFDEIKKQPYGVEFTQEDASWVFAHQTIQWIYCENPFAFIALGKGKDLVGHIHEWGGDTQSLINLFNELNRISPALQLIAPLEVFKNLKIKTSHINCEYLCLTTFAPLPENYWVGGLSSI